MTLATCHMSLQFTPCDNPKLPLTDARPAYGTAAYMTGGEIEANGVLATTCWTKDLVNVWIEETDLDAGNVRLTVLKGWAPIIRKLAIAEAEHYDVRVAFVESDVPQPVRVTEDGTATFKLPFDL